MKPSNWEVEIDPGSSALQTTMQTTFENDESELILHRFLTTGSLSSIDRQTLTIQLLSHSWQLQGLGITPQTVDSILNQRLDQLQLLFAPLQTFCQEKLGWPICPIDLLWHLWLPLAAQIAQWRSLLDRPLIQGILGIQGTGKTTLTLLLAEILPIFGYQVCHFSIDDLYKTYVDRQQLQQQDPQFCWRGPPGTHDLSLGMQVLQQLRQANFPVAIPQFDKSLHQGSGDRIQSIEVSKADIVLFEGWFVGVHPIDPQVFDAAPLPITPADRPFAEKINRLLQDYLPLWDQLDRLIVLHPADYRLSQQWRQQAEQQMIAQGRSGMSAAAVREFVAYFWKALHPELFIPPLLQSPTVDLVIEIDADHRPSAVTVPAHP